jgi:hypothetical protein
MTAPAAVQELVGRYAAHEETYRSPQYNEIDRIVFLRICEDRGIEPSGTLQVLPSAPDIYRRLGELFQRKRPPSP